jgi:hypothetical protein
VFLEQASPVKNNKNSVKIGVYKTPIGLGLIPKMERSVLKECELTFRYDKGRSHN